MSIGTTIKRLRKEKNITQEQLAEYLGITSRAVSQWECDRTAPDISQLPALANIFEVSADVLLGIDVTQKEKRIEEIVKEADKHYEVGHLEEVIRILRTGLQEFPNSYVLMGALAGCLRHMTMDPAKEDSLLQESISLAEKMPSFFSSKENLLTSIYTGAKRLEYIKCKLSAIFSMLWSDLWSINDPLDDGTRPYTNREYIQILEKYPAIMDIAVEDKNYGLFSIHMIGAYTKLAQCYILELEQENALKSLQTATEHAIWYDTQFRNREAYTCLLLRDHNFGYVYTNSNENQCLILLHRLEETIFDPIREHPEFKKVVAELQKYAKEL